MFFKKKRHKTDEGRLSIVLEDAGIDLFIDVGANVGQTGIKLRENGYLKKIISFEPVASCHAKLKNVAATYKDWDVAERMALSDYDGETEIHVSEASDLSSIDAPTKALHDAFPRSEEKATEVVQVRRLDSVFSSGFGSSRAFLKIDAQGHDYRVLKGAEGILPLLRGVQVETSLISLYENEPTYLDVLGFLHHSGFSPFIISARTFSRRIRRQLQIDAVFIREN
jgi:FkbM family methyltransferase